MRYFFHLEDGTCVRDPSGEEYSDDTVAMLVAAVVAHELSKVQVNAADWRVVVKNADGLRIGSVPFVPEVAADIPPLPIH